MGTPRGPGKASDFIMEHMDVHVDEVLRQVNSDSTSHDDLLIFLFCSDHFMSLGPRSCYIKATSNET